MTYDDAMTTEWWRNGEEYDDVIRILCKSEFLPIEIADLAKISTFIAKAVVEYKFIIVCFSKDK